MNVSNCKQCGRVFQPGIRSICETCYKNNEDAFNRVKEYVDDHPRNTLHEVSQNTEVSPGLITKWIREGRLKATQGMSEDFVCRSCNRPIQKGHMCGECAQKMVAEVKVLENTEAEEPKHEGMRMHTSLIKKQQ